MWAEVFVAMSYSIVSKIFRVDLVKVDRVIPASYCC
jgi:hypothetical protein